MEGVDPTEDAVGRTSARLLAAGVGSRERLDALHLLAILDASADVNGRVRRPLDDLADEFELSPSSVLRSLDHLVAAGAIERDGAAVVLPRHGQAAVGGMLLADFVADVRSALDEVPPAPAHHRLLARASVGLVAAAVVVVVALVAPGAGGPTTPVASPGTSSAAAPEAAPRATSATPAIADDVTSPAAERSSAPRPSSTVASPTETTAAVPACPTGVPTAVVTTEQAGLGETATTVGSGPAITGTATNPTTADVVITAMRARSGATEGSLTEPLVVPAGQTVAWSVPVERLGVPSQDEAVIEAWEWVDPAHASCPS